MYQFEAKNAEQLDRCLRMLHPEKIKFEVITMENEKRKIEYRVKVDIDEDRFTKLNKMYQILIS